MKFPTFRSGFEDDFNSVSDVKSLSSRGASRSTTFSNDPFDLLDDFASSSAARSSVAPSTVKNTVNIRNLKPAVLPKPVSIGNTNFYASGTQSPSNFVTDDTSKSVKPNVSMPTIIKPASSSSLASRKTSPTHVPSPSPSSMLNDFKKFTIGPMSNYKELDATSDESFEDEPPSPPMPTIPAPVLVLDNQNVGEDEEKESHAIALYDFESDVTEDLNFKVSEKFSVKNLKFLILFFPLRRQMRKSIF